MRNIFKYSLVLFVQDTYMQFDMVRSTFILVNRLIDERNQKINDFMDVLQDLEKKRTTLVEDCYKRNMIDNKELPYDSFQRLYKKYLKVNQTLFIKYKSFLYL